MWRPCASCVGAPLAGQHAREVASDPLVLAKLQRMAGQLAAGIRAGTMTVAALRASEGVNSSAAQVACKASHARLAANC